MSILRKLGGFLFPISLSETEKRKEAERNRAKTIEDRRRLRIPDMADIDYKKQTRRDDGDDNSGFKYSDHC